MAVLVNVGQLPHVMECRIPAPQVLVNVGQLLHVAEIRVPVLQVHVHVGQILHVAVIRIPVWQVFVDVVHLHHVAKIRIPALEGLANVGQLPHVDRLRCLIIHVQALPANVDQMMHALPELQNQHVYPQRVQPQHQLTHLLLARYSNTNFNFSKYPGLFQEHPKICTRTNY